MSFDSNLIDIHCHKLEATDDLQVVSLDAHQLTSPRTSISAPERALVTSCPTGQTDQAYFSLGIHPWFIENQDIQAAFKTLNNYRNNPRLLAIGECGLDKCIDTPMTVQREVFDYQIELAEQWEKPLIIHCVRAFNELIQIKKLKKPALPWIIHGFNHPPQLAKQLLQHNCYLSFGKALLFTESKAAEALKLTPPDRFFLETDDATDVPISAIYSAAAKITGLTIDDLSQQIFSNFKRAFFHD